jgi:predicted phage terminase large subunit-like protein
MPRPWRQSPDSPSESMPSSAVKEKLAELDTRLTRLEAAKRPSLSVRDFAARYLKAEARQGELVPLVPATALHECLATDLNELRHTRGQKRCYLAPRGSAKTTWTTFAFPLAGAVQGWEPYTVLTADTGDQAQAYLETIKRELEENEALAAAYPDACGKGPIWRGNRIRLRNGVEIAAYGTGAKLRGRKAGVSRPSLIIIDDPQNKDHIVSELQRRRSWEWMTKDVLNAGTPQTNVVVAGTALHRECIVCRLEKAPGWKTRVYKSMIDWPERRDLWQEWENILLDWEDDERGAKAFAFYEAHKAEMDAGAQLLWPEREPLYELMSHRIAVGSAAFESEKQNNPVDPELCEFPDEYFTHGAFWFDKWPEHLEIKTLALDPSKGADAKIGDYRAFVKLGRNRNGVMFCEADLRRCSTDVITDESVEFVKTFQPDGFAVEINLFQELFIADMQRAALAARIALHLHGVNNQVNKAVRIRRLGSYLSQRLFRFKAKSRGTDLLVQQLRDFPNGDHDDGPDALEMALRLMIELYNAGLRR